MPHKCELLPFDKIKHRLRLWAGMWRRASGG